MKKSIAVILLGSAILLPNNNKVEASYSDENVQLHKSPYIECVGWKESQIECVGWKESQMDFNHIELKLGGYLHLRDHLMALLNKYSEVVKPRPSAPTEVPGTTPTPDIEQKPEVEVDPEWKPVPTPKPETPPAVEEVPDTTPDPAPTPDPEVPDVEETPDPTPPEVEQEPKPEPEEPSIPEVEPTPPTTPVDPAPEQPKDPVEENSVSAIEQAVLNLTNAERQKAGLAPLQSDGPLMASAREKSKDMSRNNYFSHTSPTYGSPFDQMKAFGITYRSAAENIAMGQRTAEDVVRGWMASPGHRQNILGANFTHIGIGYDANGNYWTQQFIQK